MPSEQMFNRSGETLNNFNILQEFLSDFDIDYEDICIVASGTLHVAGIRDNGDLDIIVGSEVRRRLLEEAQSSDKLDVKRDGKIIYSSTVDIVQPDRYESFGIPDDAVVSDDRFHIEHNGLKFVRPELVLSKKWRQSRRKDLDDVKLIEDSGIMDYEAWNWELVAATPPWERPGNQSVHVRFIKSLKSKGVRATTKKTLRHLIDKIPNTDSFKREHRYTNMVQFARQFDRSQSHGASLSIPLGYLLSSQYDGGEFVRWDVVACAALREEIVDDVPEQFQQSQRPRDAAITDNSPVVNEDLQIVSGEEYISAAIGSNSDVVQCGVCRKTKSETYSWVDIQQAYDSTGADAISTYRKHLFMRTGVYFFAVIWPPAIPFSDEIVDAIDSKATVVFDLKRKYEGDWMELINEIYSIDPTVRDWTLRKKAHDFDSRDTSSLRILAIECPSPSFDYTKRSPVSSVTSDLKDSCRKSVYERVENYFYDNIVHMTDNYVQNAHMYEVLLRQGLLDEIRSPAREI